MFSRTILLSASPERGWMDLLSPAETDPLADTLAAIGVKSSVYCLSELAGPWAFSVEGASVAKFHLVLDGGCWLDLAEREPVRLDAGDLVILPGGDAHVMRSEPGAAARTLDSLLADYPLDVGARLRVGGTGPRTRLLCGGFMLDNPLAVNGRLPALLQLKSADYQTGAWLEPVLALARQEADHAAPGGQAVFTKLADVFLTQALRAYLVKDGQLAAASAGPAQDTLVERAAELLCQQLARQWTLQLLAREVGMSRSLLVTRFRAATGESPMRHLAKLRLGQAAAYLTTASLSVDAIARRTGYSSSASLSKAFKREFGVAPGKYRALKADVSVVPLH
jgi:AraC-like DNA-binding protein